MFARVTDSAALVAACWVGKGDKEATDGAAVTAMMTITQTMVMRSNPVLFAISNAHLDLDRKPLFKDNRKIKTRLNVCLK